LRHGKGATPGFYSLGASTTAANFFFCFLGGQVEKTATKRPRIGEILKKTKETTTIGRPTLYTPEIANRLAEHISTGLTDEQAAVLRLKDRLARSEAGEQGWQGTAWALERIYPQRFSRPDIQLAQQINVGPTDTLTEFPQRLRVGKEPQIEMLK